MAELWRDSDVDQGLCQTQSSAYITAALAAFTSVTAPLDIAYLGYFDYRTLTCLFCTLSVICALKEIRFFYVCAEKITSFAKNLQLAAVVLVYITFIGSMLNTIWR